jgi:hypothetical protein
MSMQGSEDWRPRPPQSFLPLRPKFPRNVCELNSATHPVEHQALQRLRLNKKHQPSDTFGDDCD